MPAADDDLQAQARARVGRVLHNKWRLDKLLGLGGMAAVYEATHRNANRAAVKVLHEELAGVPEIKTRFLREGYVANTIGHAGAVRVLDDDADADGTVFLVMELLIGETLAAATQVRARKMQAPEVARIAVALLDVLGAAHAKGIVHRDVKPENVFLTREGDVKLLDFGFARVADAAQTASSLTGMHTTLGTPGFMSPEQARGDWSIVDARSDLWAVGATMFAMLSGRPVHEGKTVADVMVAAATKPARSLKQVAPLLPQKLIAVVDQALAFDRNKRWATARAMQAALRGAVAVDDEATNPEVARSSLEERPIAEREQKGAAPPAPSAAPSPPSPRSAPRAVRLENPRVARAPALPPPSPEPTVMSDTVSETMLAVRVDASGAPLSGIPRIARPPPSSPGAVDDAAVDSARVVVETSEPASVDVAMDLPDAPPVVPEAPLPLGFRPPAPSNPFWERAAPGAASPPMRAQVRTQPDMHALTAHARRGRAGLMIGAAVAALLLALAALVAMLLRR